MINIGDMVMLAFGPMSAQLGVTPELRQLEERKYRVKSYRWLGGKLIYELDGCKSKAGIPFTITEDWIVPITY